MYQSDEKIPLVGNVRERVVYVIHYYNGHEQIIWRLLLSFFGFFLAFYLLFYSPIFRQDDPYTYYLMTKRWPAGECKFNNQCFRDLSKYNQWVIHGLWPEFSNNSWDQFCTKNKFDKSQVMDIIDDLTVNWPNLLNNKDVESLWAHEWEKHGTCSPLNQKQYFQETLSFHRTHNVTEWLKRADIVPSNRKQYHKRQFHDAFPVNPESVQFNCENRGSESYLKEIYFCLSFKDAKTLVPCTVRTNCKDYFYYPALE